MGNRRLNSVTHIRELDSWTKAGITEYSSEILKNPQTGQEIQKFIVDHLDSDNLNTQLKVYFLRINELPRSVRVLHYGYEKSNSICASTEYFVVITQKTTRFCDLSPITISEANSFLEQSLKGFSLLFQLFGLFTITADLISLNDQNQIKVWLNRNFGLNTIDEDPSIAISQRYQIQILVELIKRKIRQEERLQNFGNQIIGCDKFQDAIKVLTGGRNSLEATASFANVSVMSDSNQQQKNLDIQQINIKQPEVRILYKNSPLIVKRASHSANVNPLYVPEFHMIQRTDESVLQNRNMINIVNIPAPSSPLSPPSSSNSPKFPDIQRKSSLPTSSVHSSTHQTNQSRMLVHYTPIDMKKSLVSRPTTQRIPDHFRNLYQIPVVNSEIIVEKVSYSIQNMNLSRMKMQGATILESRVISHP